MKPELIGIQGRDGKTPLHRVAETDYHVLLGDFLVHFPDAIDKLTIHGESAVHCALKSHKIHSFHILYGWLCRTGRLNDLRWRDWNDNTLLHVAAENDQPEVISILLKEKVPLNMKNADGFTPLDRSIDGSIGNKLLKENGGKVGNEVEDKSYMGYLRQNVSHLERFLLLIFFLEVKLTNEHGNVILVVAALICTTTFQAMVQPPSTLTSKALKKIFAVTNAISFFISLGMMIILTPGRRYTLMLH